MRHGSSLFLGLALALTGCPGSTPATDSGTQPDAVATADTGVTTDSGGTTADTGGGTTDTGGGGDVARCQAASAALAASCPSDGGRHCQAAAYASYCNADGSPGLFADALDCLAAMSGSSGCRSFSDPSGADACVAAVYAGVTNAAVDAVIARVNTLCTTDQSPARTEPPLYALTPSQLSALQTCLDAAANCDATMPCVAAFEGPIQACFP